jgi:hypothetical protein
MRKFAGKRIMAATCLGRERPVTSSSPPRWSMKPVYGESIRLGVMVVIEDGHKTADYRHGV